MTIEQVWKALDEGKTVYWKNEGYKVFIEDISRPGSDAGKFQIAHFSHRNGKMLAVRYISNYFGSIIHESDLSNLFVKGQ